MKLFDIFKKKQLNVLKDEIDFHSTDQGQLQDDEYTKRGIQALKSNIAGMEFVMAGEYDKAVAFFDIAIENGVEKAMTYKYRGLCFQKAHFNSKALEDFNKSIQINPEDWEAYYFRATSLDKFERYDEELFDLNKLINLLKQKKKLDSDESRILSSCEIDIKRTIELKKCKEELNRLDNEWEQKLKEVQENALKRKAQKNEDDNIKNNETA